MAEKRYFMKIKRPGTGGLIIGIDLATFDMVREWFFEQVTPGMVLSNEPFQIVQYYCVGVNEDGEII